MARQEGRIALSWGEGVPGPSPDGPALRRSMGPAPSELPGDLETTGGEAIDFQAPIATLDMAPFHREDPGRLESSQNGRQSTLGDSEGLADARLTELRRCHGTRR
jgi:hypothetical protein